ATPRSRPVIPWWPRMETIPQNRCPIPRGARTTPQNRCAIPRGPRSPVWFRTDLLRRAACWSAPAGAGCPAAEATAAAAAASAAEAAASSAAEVAAARELAGSTARTGAPARARPGTAVRCRWDRNLDLIAFVQSGGVLGPPAGEQTNLDRAADLLAAGDQVDDPLPVDGVHRRGRNGEHVGQLLVDQRHRRRVAGVQPGRIAGDRDDDRECRNAGRGGGHDTDRQDRSVHHARRAARDDLRLVAV